MSREDEIAKIDAELEKLGVENEAEEEIEEVEETEGEEESEDETPEKKEEEVKPEEKKEIKLEVNTDLPPATLGFKLREEARKREAAERELAELKKPKIEEGDIEGEIRATKQELQELKEWKAEQEKERQANEQREGAFRELQTYENEASQAYADYNDASAYAKQMIAASIKVLNPGISNDDLARQTVDTYARHAGTALVNKKHPGQAIYEMAQQLGYKKAEERPQIEVKQDNKIPLTKLAENKKKSSGMGTGSNGKAFMTMEAVAAMTNAERMTLSESDWARLESEG